ncbi:SOS response-associated peptidase [Pelagibius sp. Alg239-R121]|uniref:SOS response-associated peptidase n=1 Tax=Pelagibius sp. Alg239-R121 TaxID=2993448 RepID=UPI0024A750E2|nr:SOS response-associated peptidase family protein [Pelagibius sp. Alg239-R121]
MCGSFDTANLSWQDIVDLARLTTNEPLPLFSGKDRFPMRKKTKAAGEWNGTPIIRDRNDVREAAEAQWGLVPFWWRKPLSEKAFDTFNAKLEGVRETKSYRHALEKQRCVIPTSCFYESTGPKGGKTKHRVTLAGGGPVMLAGLYDYNKDLELLSFTIITTEPGPRFRAFHHRVPAILPGPGAIEGYLSGPVDEAIAIAGRSTDELLVMDPPEPAEPA